ncbi:antitoxin Xre/MbcA/ParS toxin-binding domain-containing protein [Photobacterium leiognathi]|uniref:antitoxin Xre/MbcA/ParS toxin-binding domain-containing protein n=1 Tax=Photobacterium leiognathi TaxID=553611 RepID=UPI0027368D7D|nr:antitoxin Xre/MbcA/ParS toxin-binding domain-containing protein [Photobacterium leiognathi]
MSATSNSCILSGLTPLPENIFNNDMIYYKTVMNGISGKVIKWAVLAMPKQKKAIVKALGTTSGKLSHLYEKSKLNTHQTEEILDIVKLYTEVCDVFGSVDKADLWLSMSIPALRGEQPIDLLDTFIGRKLVRGVINKIKFGDFS